MTRVFFCYRAPEVRSYKLSLEHSYKPSYWHIGFPILLFGPTNAWPQTQVSLGLGFCPFLKEEVQGEGRKNTMKFTIWGFGCFLNFFKHCQRQWLLHGLKECADKKVPARKGAGTRMPIFLQCRDTSVPCSLQVWDPCCHDLLLSKGCNPKSPTSACLNAKRVDLDSIIGRNSLTLAQAAQRGAGYSIPGSVYFTKPVPNKALYEDCPHSVKLLLPWVHFRVTP